MNRTHEILENLEHQSLSLNDFRAMFTDDISGEIENLLVSGRILMVGNESDFNPDTVDDSPMYILNDDYIAKINQVCLFVSEVSLDGNLHQIVVVDENGGFLVEQRDLSSDGLLIENITPIEQHDTLDEAIAVARELVDSLKGIA